MKKYLPDIFTSFNLLCGCFSVAFVMQNEMETACYLIFIAAVFDFLDGFLARSLDAYSPFGKQLDSLADMTSFGVAPGLIMYRYIDNNVAELPPPAQIILAFSMLLIPLFSAIRLARFNIDPKQEDTFTGLPTPANALFLASLPVITSGGSPSFLLNPWMIAPLALLFAVLMVSPVKMVAFKFKDYTWNNNRTRYLFVGLCFILIVIFQFIAIPLIIIFYILYPVSISRDMHTQGNNVYNCASYQNEPFKQKHQLSIMKKFNCWVAKFSIFQKILFLIFAPSGSILFVVVLITIIHNVFRKSPHDIIKIDDKLIWFSYISVVVFVGYKLFITTVEKWILNLNSQQKLILSIVIPIGLGILFYPIAGQFDGYEHAYMPFFFEETWAVWFIFIILIGFIEYKLFENKKL